MPNTIAQNLQRLVTAKDAISSAITAKGGTVNSGDGLEEFPADIATIPSGGGEPLSPTRSGATIYDFDGSVIATYTPEEFAALTEYPEHPEHEFLTGDGYNWSLANAKAYSAKYGYVEVGAQYRVTDGKTRLFIRLEEGRLEPQLGLGINGSVEVDWGDGSAHDTMTGSVGNTAYQAHTYAQAGDYIITLTVIEGIMQFNGTSGYGYILGKSGGTRETNRVYLNALRSIYIGDGVRTIGGNAFESCYSLASVVIPGSVTVISNRAFYYCSALASVVLPDSVTSTTESTFQYCTTMVSIILPDNMTSILSYAFQGCFCLASITIPDSVTNIVESVFQNCSALASVVLPDSVTILNNQMFVGCNSLASVTIPDSVTSIRSHVLYNCYGLGFIKFTSETPPTVANVNAFNNLPTDCIIYVPHGTLATYTSATNYPDPATYTYVEY